MNIGISQLAFDNISNIIYNLKSIKDTGLNNIEIVFSKFKDINEILNIKNKLDNNGIKTKSTQSILFNSNIKDLTDLNIIQYMSNLIEKCKITDTDILVLGSPKCRNILDYSKLIDIFKIIDQFLISNNKILCIEPNCKKYNGKYFYTVSEIVKFIIDGKFCNIKTMIDTHNIIDPKKCYEQYKDYIYHIHISEDDLKPFVESDLHYSLSNSIKNSKYNLGITYEVLPHPDIKKSIENFYNIYGDIK